MQHPDGLDRVLANQDAYGINKRSMRDIPIAAAEKIAKSYGYDQVVIMARRVGNEPHPHGEHITTYGVNKAHCDVAAIMGDKLKEIAGWPDVQKAADEIARLKNLIATYEKIA